MLRWSEKCCSCSCKLIHKRTVFLECSCLIALCDDCGKAQLLENDEPLVSSFIMCPLCGGITPCQSIISESNIKKAEIHIDKLLTHAYKRLNLGFKPTQSRTVNVIKYNPIIETYACQDQQFNSLYDIKTVKKLQLHLSIIESGILSLELQQYGFLTPPADPELTRSPLDVISIASNPILERAVAHLSGGETFSLDTTCSCCRQAIGCGQSVLFKCACFNNYICRDCIYPYVANQTDTYTKGINCILCKEPSFVINNVDAVRTAEERLLAAARTRFSVTRKRDDPKDLWNLYLAYAGQDMQGTIPTESFLDEAAHVSKKNSAAILRLEIAKLELRCQLKEETLSDVQDVYEFLGPMVELDFKANKFLEALLVHSTTTLPLSEVVALRSHPTPCSYCRVDPCSAELLCTHMRLCHSDKPFLQPSDSPQVIEAGGQQQPSQRQIIDLDWSPGMVEIESEPVLAAAEGWGCENNEVFSSSNSSSGSRAESDGSSLSSHTDIEGDIDDSEDYYWATSATQPQLKQQPQWRQWNMSPEMGTEPARHSSVTSSSGSGRSISAPAADDHCSAPSTHSAAERVNVSQLTVEIAKPLHTTPISITPPPPQRVLNESTSEKLARLQSSRKGAPFVSSASAPVSSTSSAHGTSEPASRSYKRQRSEPSEGQALTEDPVYLTTAAMESFNSGGVSLEEQQTQPLTTCVLPAPLCAPGPLRGILKRTFSSSDMYPSNTTTPSTPNTAASAKASVRRVKFGQNQTMNIDASDSVIMMSCSRGSGRGSGSGNSCSEHSETARECDEEEVEVEFVIDRTPSTDHICDISASNGNNIANNSGNNIRTHHTDKTSAVGVTGGDSKFTDVEYPHQQVDGNKKVQISLNSNKENEQPTLSAFAASAASTAPAQPAAGDQTSRLGGVSGCHASPTLSSLDGSRHATGRDSEHGAHHFRTEENRSATRGTGSMQPFDDNDRHDLWRRNHSGARDQQSAKTQPLSTARPPPLHSTSGRGAERYLPLEAKTVAAAVASQQPVQPVQLVRPVHPGHPAHHQFSHHSPYSDTPSSLDTAPVPAPLAVPLTTVPLTTVPPTPPPPPLVLFPPKEEDPLSLVNFFSRLRLQEMGDFILHLPVASKQQLANSKKPARDPYRFTVRFFFDPHFEVAEKYPEFNEALLLPKSSQPTSQMSSGSVQQKEQKEHYYETEITVVYPLSRLKVLDTSIGRVFKGAIKEYQVLGKQRMLGHSLFIKEVLLDRSVIECRPRQLLN